VFVKRLSVKGFCPTQNKDYSVTVDYIDATTLTQKAAVKGLAKCEFNKYGDACPIAKNCPIIRSAPEAI
jgi:hypothetical protein